MGKKMVKDSGREENCGRVKEKKMMVREKGEFENGGIVFLSHALWFCRNILLTFGYFGVLKERSKYIGAETHREPFAELSLLTGPYLTWLSSTVSYIIYSSSFLLIQFKIKNNWSTVIYFLYIINSNYVLTLLLFILILLCEMKCGRFCFCSFNW